MLAACSRGAVCVVLRRGAAPAAKNIVVVLSCAHPAPRPPLRLRPVPRGDLSHQALAARHNTLPAAPLCGRRRRCLPCTRGASRGPRRRPLAHPPAVRAAAHGAFFMMSCDPCSSYSAFDIHSCCMLPSDARIEPPIQTENLRSSVLVVGTSFTLA